METFVQHAVKGSALLTIPSVRVVVHTEPRPTVLGEDNYQEDGWRSPVDKAEQCQESFESIKRNLAQRDWRKLRERLVNLDIDDTPSVCEWLGSAGYVPQAMLAKPNAVFFTGQDIQRMSTGNLGWQPDFATPTIRQWLKRYRDVFAWLVTLKDCDFREAVRAAREFFVNRSETVQTEVQSIRSHGRKPRLKDPGVMFLKETAAPADLDADVLSLALRGTTISEAARAHFLWDDDGRPWVVAHADSPIAAICISIHIDRNFSSRSWVRCIRCGKWLEKIRGRDRFCSKGCRNYYTTAERRKKIKLLAKGVQEWEKLPARRREEHDRSRWIAAWAKRKSHGRIAIEPSWAKQELAKVKAQKQKETSLGKHKLQGGKNGT